MGSGPGAMGRVVEMNRQGAIHSNIILRRFWKASAESRPRRRPTGAFLIRCGYFSPQWPAEAHSGAQRQLGRKIGKCYTCLLLIRVF